MSVLRDTVTGTDGCTANGAGPSNPLSGIADTLLGTSSKTRSRLHEVWTSTQSCAARADLTVVADVGKHRLPFTHFRHLASFVAHHDPISMPNSSY
jgi:hypothetical protein